MRKRANIHFTTLRNRSNDYKSNLISRFAADCLEDFTKGTLKPIIDKIFSLSQASDAHRYMESNENIGKILLKQDL